MPTATIPIDVVWSGATGSPGVNVWHGRTGSFATGSPGLSDMIDALEDFYRDMAPFFSPSLQFRFAGESKGVGDDAGTTVTNDPWTVTGSGSGNYLPPATCILISWKTGSGGRSGMGRTFLGPTLVGLQDANGRLSGVNADAMQVIVDRLVQQSQGLGDGALGVYSPTQNIFRDFSSGVVRRDYAVLRSRRD